MKRPSLWSLWPRPLRILEQIAVRPIDRVLVIGDGKLGLLISMVLRLTGCNLKLVGKHPDKLALFSALGGSVERLESFFVDDHSFDTVIEASGHPSGWEPALRNVKPRRDTCSKKHISWND